MSQEISPATVVRMIAYGQVVHIVAKISEGYCVSCVLKVLLIVLVS